MHATSRPAAFNNLASALSLRARLTGAGSDLDEALATTRRSLAHGDVDTRAAGTARLNLGNRLSERFERSGQRADPDAAVTVLRAAEAMVGVTERSGLFLNLANALARRHARFADPTDLDAAVVSARQAVAHAEPGSIRLLRYRTTLAHLQTMRARRFSPDGARSGVVANPPLFARHPVARWTAALGPERIAPTR